MAPEHDISYIYSRFDGTRWHKGRAPNTTYCVVEFPTELGCVQIFQNGSNHAELKMIEELKKRIDELWDKGASAPTHVRIRVYMNYSPCSDCSDELEHCIDMYKDRNIIIYFDIVAACPYKVSRPSCTKSWSQCPDGSNLHRHPAGEINEKGLSIFNKTPQLCLRAFNKDDWQYLLPRFLEAAEHKIGEVEPIDDDEYKHEENEENEEYEKGDTKHRSRKLQDRCTKYDFSKHAPKLCSLACQMHRMSLN